MGSIAWNGVISYNLIVNLRNPFVNTAAYGKFYHLFVWTLCASTAAIFPIFDIAGPSGDNTCWFDENPLKANWSWRLMFYGPLLVFWCISAVALFMGLSSTRRVMSNARSRRIIIKRMVAFTLVFILFLLGSLVHRLVQMLQTADVVTIDPTVMDGLKNWDAVTAVSVGFANSLVWISNPLFWTELKSHVLLPLFTRIAPRSWVAEALADDAAADAVQVEPVSTASGLTPRSERVPLISQVSRLLSYESEHDDFTMVDFQLRKRIIRCLLHGICQLRRADAQPRDGGHLLYNYADFETVFVAVGNPADNPDRVTYRFCEYAPKVFHAVRGMCDVDEDQFKAAFDAQRFFANPANLKFSEGRSGSFFGFSPDRRFIIKTLDAPEFDLLLKSLPAYCRHLEKHPSSLCVRFFGLYSLAVDGFADLATLRVVAMSNVFHLPPTAALEEQYDLKGSWVQRHSAAHDADRHALGMDTDLTRNLDLTEHDRKAFVEQAAADAEFLASLNIMDYSLLLGFVPLTDELRRDVTLDEDAAALPSVLRPPMRKRVRRSQPKSAASSSAVAADDVDSLSRSMPSSSTPPPSSTAMHDLRSSASATLDDDVNVSALRSAVNMEAGDQTAAGDADGDGDFDADSQSHASEFVIGANRTRNGRWMLRSRDGRSLYVFGIIDMLQLYNTQKKMERFVKVRVLCKDRDGISVQTPPTYAKRFLFRVSTLSTGRLRTPVEYRALARKSISMRGAV
jgi:hypothetical protein